MNIRKFAIAALVATSMVALPVAAEAGKARSAAVSKTTAVRKDANHLAGSGLIIALIAAAAVVGGIIAASSSSSPKSP
jgi:hypothetical protein